MLGLNKFYLHYFYKSQSNFFSVLITVFTGFLFFYFIVFGLTSLNADEYYELTGDNINYDYEAGVISAVGQARFVRGEMEVRAEEIEFYLRSGDILAHGEIVSLLTPDEHIKGDSLIYNYYERQGELVGAHSRIDDLYVQGERIRMVSDKDHTFETEEAMFTPCILPDPHYRIEAERVLFYPQDRIVAEQVSFLWGETTLITLPNYVIELEKDEKTGEVGPKTPPSLLYNLGFDWQDGIFLEVEYPYELGDLTEGYFYFREATDAPRIISAVNVFNPIESVGLDTFYHREEKSEEGEFILQEEYGSEFTYSPGDHYSAEIGYRYEDDDGEIDENYYLGWLHTISPDLWLRQRLRLVHRRKEDEDDGVKHHPLTTTLNYDPEGRKQRLDFHYDFYDREWRREYFIEEELPQKALISFYRDYQGDSLERQKYTFSQELEVLDYSLRYHRGYDTEFLPYAKFDFELPHNLELAAGYGRLAETGEQVGQIAFNPSWGDSWQPLSDLVFSAELSYHHIYYSSPAQPGYYRALETELGVDHKLQISPDLDMEFSFYRQENFQEGEAYLERDKVDRELIYGLDSRLEFASEEQISDLDLNLKSEYSVYAEELIMGVKGNLDIATGAPESGLVLGWQSEYKVFEEEWEELIVNFKRYLDCYSYNFRYDFRRESFRAGISFDI